MRLRAGLEATGETESLDELLELLNKRERQLLPRTDAGKGGRVAN
jgi:hypothetical protein